MKEFLYRFSLNKFCVFFALIFGLISLLAVLAWTSFAATFDLEIIYADPTEIARTPSSLATSKANAPSPSPSPLVVDIGGAVRAPGLYVLDPESVLADLVAKAGGFRTDVIDTYLIGKQLNLAQSLISGRKYYIPFVGEAWSSDGGGSQVVVTTGTSDIVSSSVADCTGVSVNNADLKNLQTLSGVGEVRAQSIVDNRPYTELAELVSKGALTQSLFDKLKDELCL